jgi:hypothetical protein
MKIAGINPSIFCSKNWKIRALYSLALAVILLLLKKNAGLGPAFFI